jgi:hypothetical protein
MSYTSATPMKPNRNTTPWLTKKIPLKKAGLKKIFPKQNLFILRFAVHVFKTLAAVFGHIGYLFGLVFAGI